MFCYFDAATEAKIAVAVDILKLSFPSPPVPHVSSIFIPAFIFDFCLNIFAASNISLILSPFVAKAVKNPAFSISESFPEIICLKINLASKEEVFIV